MIASCTLVKKSCAGRTLLPSLLLRQLAEQLKVLGFVVHGALTRMCMPKATVAGEISTPVASKYVPVSTSQKGGALWIRAVASGGVWSLEVPCALFIGLICGRWRQHAASFRLIPCPQHFGGKLASFWVALLNIMLTQPGQ